MRFANVSSTFSATLTRRNGNVGLNVVFALFCRGEEEKFRRISIFGDFITCVRWEGRLWITGPDVFKAQCALYRLEHRKSVPLKRKFEECILTQLRGIGEDDGMMIAPSGSVLINYLYAIGAVRTRKRQKVFEWSRVKVLKVAIWDDTNAFRSMTRYARHVRTVRFRCQRDHRVTSRSRRVANIR